MITYKKEELLSSSKVVREFSKLLNRLRSNSVEKIAVMRNNSIEAVIIPLNEYERLQETQDMIEHKEIYNIVKEREKTEKSSISLDNILKEYKINKNEL